MPNLFYHIQTSNILGLTYFFLYLKSVIFFNKNVLDKTRTY